ncbi:MAG: IS21 family transposase [Alphaproteobacteria bacterium]|nr:IS21 family transposase [Alphaproteobacteria bacterium]
MSATLPTSLRPPAEGGVDHVQTPEEVAAMRHLHDLGWGIKRIAREMGCSRNTVRRYVRGDGWTPYARGARDSALDGVGDWLRDAFRQHRGNAAVLRDELARVHGVDVSLRTVQRAVAPLRREIRAEARATLRFETPPGRQLQIDFGVMTVVLGGVKVRAHVFVATLGHSRRLFAQAFARENQSAWLAGLEAAFLHFGGVPAEVLFDNTRCLVKHHDPRTREVAFNDTLLAFCRHWKTAPRACAPYRAQTKGKDERGVGYVRGNAIAGRAFEDLQDLNAWLARWCREVADLRVHGTTGERPADRFETAEAAALAPLVGTRWSKQRDLARIVATDAFVDVDTNRYSVPWRHIGETVHVAVHHGEVVVRHAGHVIARHRVVPGRHQRVVDPRHLAGIVAAPAARVQDDDAAPQAPHGDAELLRPLAHYEAVVGGAW